MQAEAWSVGTVQVWVRARQGNDQGAAALTLVWMVRAKSPAQLQYTDMLVSFTPWHFRQT